MSFGSDLGQGWQRGLELPALGCLDISSFGPLGSLLQLSCISQGEGRRGDHGLLSWPLGLRRSFGVRKSPKPQALASFWPDSWRGSHRGGLWSGKEGRGDGKQTRSVSLLPNHAKDAVGVTWSHWTPGKLYPFIEPGAPRYANVLALQPHSMIGNPTLSNMAMFLSHWVSFGTLLSCPWQILPCRSVSWVVALHSSS